jgi:hypothetical protein
MWDEGLVAEKAMLIRSLPPSCLTALTGVVLAALACCDVSPLTPAAPPPSIHDKLDPALRRQLDDINRRGQSDQRLSVLVRTASEMTPDQEHQLRRLGVTIRSKSGIILSATLPASSISEVAGLDFIVRIELARRLKPREE